MSRKLTFVAVLFLGFVALSFCGCPDRSHQRAVPDYGSMSDSGGGDEDEDKVSPNE